MEYSHKIAYSIYGRSPTTLSHKSLDNTQFQKMYSPKMTLPKELLQASLCTCVHFSVCYKFPLTLKPGNMQSYHWLPGRAFREILHFSDWPNFIRERFCAHVTIPINILWENFIVYSKRISQLSSLRN